MEEGKVGFFSPDDVVKNIRKRKLLGEDVYNIILGETMGSHTITRIAFKNYILKRFSSIARKSLRKAREMATSTLFRLIAESVFPQVREDGKNFDVSIFSVVDNRVASTGGSLPKYRYRFKLFLEIDGVDEIDTVSPYSILAVTLPGFLSLTDFTDVYWTANTPLFMTLRSNGKVLERSISKEYVNLIPDYVAGNTEKNLEDTPMRDDDEEFAYQLFYLFQMPRSFRAFEIKNGIITFDLDDFQERYESFSDR